MQTVRLITETGGFVCRAEIPPFQTWPKVLHWGARTFLLDDGSTDSEGTLTYREAFTVALVSEIRFEDS